MLNLVQESEATLRVTMDGLEKKACARELELQANIEELNKTVRAYAHALETAAQQEKQRQEVIKYQVGQHPLFLQGYNRFCNIDYC